jgi:hypothetical protein
MDGVKLEFDQFIRCTQDEQDQASTFGGLVRCELGGGDVETAPLLAKGGRQVDALTNWTTKSI